MVFRIPSLDDLAFFSDDAIRPRTLADHITIRAVYMSIALLLETKLPTKVHFPILTVYTILCSSPPALYFPQECIEDETCYRKMSKQMELESMEADELAPPTNIGTFRWDTLNEPGTSREHSPFSLSIFYEPTRLPGPLSYQINSYIHVHKRKELFLFVTNKKMLYRPNRYPTPQLLPVRTGKSPFVPRPHHPRRPHARGPGLSRIAHLHCQLAPRGLYQSPQPRRRPYAPLAARQQWQFHSLPAVRGRDPPPRRVQRDPPGPLAASIRRLREHIGPHHEPRQLSVRPPRPRRRIAVPRHAPHRRPRPRGRLV